MSRCAPPRAAARVAPPPDSVYAGYAPGVSQLRGRLRLIAALHDPAVIRKLLAHLGMARSGPSPGPAPPESGGVAS